MPLRSAVLPDGRSFLAAAPYGPGESQVLTRMTARERPTGRIR
jgi:hypothetical protein